MTGLLPAPTGSLSTSIRLIVGLGNPGRDYADTRHNAGFIAIDAVAAKFRVGWSRRAEFEAELARVSAAAGGHMHLLKPATYMNESGRSVAAVCRFLRIDPSEVVVIFDEINLPIGRAKLSISGSAGGHNGLASVISHFGGSFKRLRIGIGPRHPPQIDLKDYVLGKLSPEQQTILHLQLPEIIAGLDLLIERGLAAAMNRINRRPSTDDRSNQENL